MRRSAVILMYVVMILPVAAQAFRYDPSDLGKDENTRLEIANRLFKAMEDMPEPDAIGDFGFENLDKIRATQIGLGVDYANDGGAKIANKKRKGWQLEMLEKPTPIVRCKYKNGTHEDFGDDRHHDRWGLIYWLFEKYAVVYIKNIIEVGDETDCAVELIKTGSMYTFDQNGKPIGNFYKKNENGELMVDPTKVTRQEARKVLALMPKTVRGTKNDPYRSLAGFLRELNMFSKNAPFADFRVANWLRPRMKIDDSSEQGWENTIEVGKKLMRTPEAAFLRMMGRCEDPLKKAKSGN